MFGTIYLHVKKQLNVLFNVNSNMGTYVTNSVITLHALVPLYVLPKRYAFMLHRQQCEYIRIACYKASFRPKTHASLHRISTGTMVYIHFALTSIPESVIMCDIVQQIIDLNAKSFICMWHLHTQKLVYSITVFADGTCLLVKGLQSCFISQHLVTVKFIAFAFHIFN